MMDVDWGRMVCDGAMMVWGLEFIKKRSDWGIADLARAIR
jgi:hypothetical protein